MLNLSFLVRLATGINCNFIVYKNYKFWWLVRIKDGIAIWAKLKQGNGRGTCCWIKHNIFSTRDRYSKKQYYITGGVKAIKLSQVWHIALRGCLDIK